MTAYAELRDELRDLNIGDPVATPVEFLAFIDPDDEHTELAWLVTRALWGDLGRDLRDDDAVLAEAYARSVGRRVRTAQPFLTRLSGLTSRVSLRDPYTTLIPNLWPQPRGQRRGLRARLRALPTAVRQLRPTSRGLPGRPAVAVLAGVLVLALLAAGVATIGGGGSGRGATPARRAALPDKLVPAQLGQFVFRAERAAERAYLKAGRRSLVEPGRVFTFRRGDSVDGALQVAAFRPGITARDKGVVPGVLAGIEGGGFVLTRVADQRIYSLTLPEQTIYVWFPPSGRYVEMLVGRRGFGDGDRLFVQLLNYQAGRDPAADSTVPVVLDPRRGADEPVVLPANGAAGPTFDSTRSTP